MTPNTSILKILSESETELGGKAFNLVWLKKNGFQVPDFFVYTSTKISQLLYDQKIDLPRNLTSVPVDKAKLELKKIRETIESCRMTQEQRAELESLVANNFSKNIHFAVRSSAIGEDSSGASFAGQMDSFLFQKSLDQVETSIWKCIASFYNERAYLYRLEKKLDVSNIRGAVIIQEMVFGDCSGVFFTAHPATGRRDLGLISACYGIGEGIVSGVCNTDEFTVDMNQNSIVESRINDKDVQCIFNESQGFSTMESPVEDALRNVACLSDQSLRDLTAVGQKISSLLGKPQDIEFSFKNNQLSILQTRPITTLPPPKKPKGIEIVWDNSNIQESYNGVTTPLTFSFASKGYKNVYTQTCHVLRVNPKSIAKLNNSLENLLGLINGRVYYNINNWYRGLLEFPSFGTNKEDMERMMGLQEEVEFVSGTALSFMEKLVRTPQIFLTLFTLLRNFKKMPVLVKEFLDFIEVEYGKIDRGNLQRLEFHQLIGLCRYLEKEVQGNWTTPILNDFYVMMMNGRVYRTLKKSGIEKPEVLQNNLMAGEEGIESTEPTKFLLRLCDDIRGDKLLLEIFSLESKFIYDRLQVLTPVFFKKCLEYIERYGDRTMGELKLESITLRQDPGFMFDVIKNYLKNSDLNLKKLGEKEGDLRHQSEKAAFEKVSKMGSRQLIKFKLNLLQLRQAVKNRENMRLSRTRLFGVYRSIYLEIGRQLEFYGYIENYRDIFYLSQDELYAYDEGRSHNAIFKPLIKSRKEEFEEYKKQDEPPHHFRTRGAPYYQNNFIYEGKIENLDPNASVFSGIGCYPGIVNGKVRIVHSPEDVSDINGQILCTVRTDPGWAPLFPTCGGILVERGSTLSHSAVVARELGIPAVVGIPGITKILQDGEQVILNGEQGTIQRCGDK